MSKIIVQGEELYHYGILGMKWGIRRYQNYDGTLTPEGAARLEKHYQKSKSKVLDYRKKILKIDNKLDKSAKKAGKLFAKSIKIENNSISSEKSDKLKKKLEKITANDKKLISKKMKYVKKAQKFIEARENVFLKINYDSIPQADIDKGKEYAIYINALQSRETTRQLSKAQDEMLRNL